MPNESSETDGYEYENVLTRAIVNRGYSLLFDIPCIKRLINESTRQRTSLLLMSHE